MKNHNCCGDSISCDIPVELPDDYMDTLYAIYTKECEASGKEPLAKPKWLESISGQ